MIYVLLLMTGFFILLAVVRGLSIIQRRKVKSLGDDVKNSFLSMLLGVPLAGSFLLIPYGTWQLTGQSHDWDGVYIIAASLFATFSCFFIMDRIFR